MLARGVNYGAERVSSGPGRPVDDAQPSAVGAPRRRMLFSRDSAYLRWMYASSSDASIRHCPRPPTWMAGSSPEVTSARACTRDTFSCSATSVRRRKRGGTTRVWHVLRLFRDLLRPAGGRRAGGARGRAARAGGVRGVAYPERVTT